MWKYNSPNEMYGKIINSPDDELKHYGVIGMRWGMRKAYNRGEEYHYKSHGQKKYLKKTNRLNARVKRIESKGKRVGFGLKNAQRNAQKKLDLYTQRDKNRQEYVETATVGKQIVKTILFGPLGNGNYMRFRAAGHGRVMSAIGSSWVASTIGYPLTLALSKVNENHTAKRQLDQMKRDENKKNNE